MKESQALGQGLPGLTLPTASPSGDRLLFVEPRSSASPGAVIVDLSSMERQSVELPLSLRAGLWGYPVWR